MVLSLLHLFVQLMSLHLHKVCKRGFVPCVMGALPQSTDSVSSDLAQGGKVINKMCHGSEIKGCSGLVGEYPDGHAD